MRSKSQPVDTETATVLASREMTADRPFTGRVNRVQILIGVFVLLLAVIAYLVDRRPDRIRFLSLFPAWITAQCAAGDSYFPRAIGGSFPSFAHVLAFSMISGGLWISRTAGYALICAIWCVIDIAFELGQGPGREVLLMLLPSAVDSLPLIGDVRAYFGFGTFDFGDLISALLGAVTALSVLLLTRQRGEIA